MTFIIKLLHYTYRKYNFEPEIIFKIMINIDKVFITNKKTQYFDGGLFRICLKR